MKNLMKILCGLALMVPSIGSAQLSGAERAAQQDAQRQQSPVCVPYTVQAPCSPCENGSGNMMCKTTTATCQDGVAVAVTTPDFNTQSCRVPLLGTSVASCEQQPEGCANVSTRSGACPAGKYWVNPPNQARPFYSSLIAVCVPSCPVGTQLSYSISPPSCIGIICPGNQRVFGNACGCPASLPVQVGNMCSAPPPASTPDCDIGSVLGASVSCAAAGFPGYTGAAFQTNFIAHGAGAAVCTPVASGYTQGSCAPPALPACDTSVVNGNPATCDAAGYPGYTGTAYETAFTTFSGGGACAQTPGGFAIGSCIPPVLTCGGSPPAATVVTCAEQTGGQWIGTPYSTTPFACSGTSWVPGGTIVNSNCSCANGNPAGTADCLACPAGTSGSYPACVCVNGATNPGGCTICPPDSSMVGGICKTNSSPPAAPTYSWVATQENSWYDPYAFSGGVRETYDCRRRNHVFQWHQAFPTDGPRLAALFAPGGDCYCGGTNPPNKDLTSCPYT